MPYEKNKTLFWIERFYAKETMLPLSIQEKMLTKISQKEDK